jgi:hypothetical protein
MSLSFFDRKYHVNLVRSKNVLMILGITMTDTVENSQIEEFILNLKGRRAYEEKKAIKQGFSNFKDYIAEKILNENLEPVNICKAPKQRVRRKNKTKIKSISTCGCC